MNPQEAGPTFLADRPMPYCKGCGHGTVTKRLDDALVRLGLSPEQVVITSDIGCVGLVDPLFASAHTVHTLHGRSTAVAAGTALVDGVLGDGRAKNVVMIGDGGATIGLLHLSQAALMNVDITVLLHNNMLYGMTGGQHSALTPEGFHTSTTPDGNWLPALDMEAFLRGSQGTFFARKLATDPDLAEVIAAAIAHPGFAMVEVLELCTGFGTALNKMDGRSLRAMAEARGHPLGVRIHRTDRLPYHAVYRDRFPVPAPNASLSGSAVSKEQRTFRHALPRPMTFIVAGSAGERVQTAAGVLAQAAVLSGLHCVQMNDYPVTVGSGFSLTEVRMDTEPILFTGCDAPDAVVIVSGDGLREVCARRVFERIGADAMVLVDETVTPGSPPEQTSSRAFRRELGASGAALGAVMTLVQRLGLFEYEAMLEAIEVVGGRKPEALRKVAETVRGWS